MHLSTLIGAVTLAAAGVQGACDYYQNDRCIKPKISFSAEVPFSPLFRSSPTFVYAVDELDRSDLDAVKRKNNLAIPSSYNGPVLKAAWWLQYDNSTVNKDRSQQRRYYAFALETGKAVGTGNTCDGLLGPTCARNLKSTIAAATLDASPYTDGGLGTAISSLYYQPPPNLSCPADIFGTRNTPPNLDVPLLLNTMEPFAVFSSSFSRDPLPSGSPDFTHGIPQFRFRSLAEQAARTVVGVTVSWPWSDFASGSAGYSLSDVKVELVCRRVGG